MLKEFQPLLVVQCTTFKYLSESIFNVMKNLLSTLSIRSILGENYEEVYRSLHHEEQFKLADGR